MSNFKSSLLLLDSKRIIEARIITRCCLENSFWITGLVEDGAKFAREMLHDTLNHRQKAAQDIFSSGVVLADDVEQRLREWLRANKKKVQNPKQLSPKAVAEKTSIARSYIFYEKLSSDSCHPSLDALQRHVIPHTPEEVGGIDVEPEAKNQELAETFQYLCIAFIGACVGVDQLLGGTQLERAFQSLAFQIKLGALADRCSDLSSRTMDPNPQAHLSSDARAALLSRQ
jgi:hypothetical protein